MTNYFSTGNRDFIPENGEGRRFFPIPPKSLHYCTLVRQFHIAFGCAAPMDPGPLDGQTRHARAQLSGEELSELSWAHAAGDLISALDALADIEYVLCGTVVATSYDLLFTPPSQTSSADGPPRLPNDDAVLMTMSMMYEGQSALCMALGVNDPARIAQVAGGMLVSLGAVWGMHGVTEELRQAILTEVHRSNMTKFGEDGRPHVNEAGRVVKGPNYEEPDILGVLRDFYGENYTPPPLRASATTPLSGALR